MKTQNKQKRCFIEAKLRPHVSQIDFEKYIEENKTIKNLKSKNKKWRKP